MKKSKSCGPSSSRTRTDWSRVDRAVNYLESTLGSGPLGNGSPRDPLDPGWLRCRLRELLEAFPTADDAQIWVKAAAFKALTKHRPKQYLALIVNDTLRDPSMLLPRNLLSPVEHEAWLAANSLEWGPDHCGPR